MAVLKRVDVSEAAIQNAVSLHFERLRHDIVAPNIASVFGWEADVLSITPKRLAHEVEIKISRGDWLKEIGPSLRGPKYRRHRTLRDGPDKCPFSGHVCRPTYFWIAVPDGVVKDGELPDYCGLMRYGDTGNISIDRKAPRLHIHPITDKQWRAAARGMSLRYWSQRRDRETAAIREQENTDD